MPFLDMRMNASGLPPVVILDSNAVLDCWLFRDPGALALAGAIESGSARWLACSRMRGELVRVLAYPQLGRWVADDGHGVLPAFDRLASVRPDPPPAPPALRCHDPDDQVFIDLAVTCGAGWLVTHDRALIALHRPARMHGIRIARPADWSTAVTRA